MFRKNNIKTLALFVMIASAQAASFKMNTVGAPGNKPDTRSGYGQVDYQFRIADKPVSNADYADFLNAVDKAGDKELFDKRMGIRRSGYPGNYTYTASKGAENKPVVYVSYANAASYCNWLSKGKVYDIVEKQVTRRRITGPDSGEVFFIPSRNEWYKGMYYKNGNYDYGKPLDVAEMISTRHRVWHRVAVGHSKNPDAYIKCNNYTNNYSGKSEDNVRKENIGFRVASMPPVHLCPELNSRFNYFYLDKQDINLKLRANSTAEIKLQVAIYDLWKNKLFNKDYALSLKPGTATIDINNVIKNPGFYSMDAVITSNNKQVFAANIPFVMMDRKRKVVRAKDSPFGISTHLDRMWNCWGRTAPEEYTPILEDLGATWVRTDTPWKFVTTGLVDKGFQILSFFPFYHSYKKFDSPFKATPVSKKWAKYGVARELSTYAQTCYNMVKDNPHVKSWEVGNEPHAWNISPADYAQMVKTAFKSAKLADPDTTVIVGDMNHIHKSVITESGAAEYSDAVAIHTYGFMKRYHEGVIDRIEALMDALRSLGFKNKPVWITEISGCGYWNHIYPGETEEERFRYQALDMPKKLAGTIALGVKKVFIYEFVNTVVSHTEGEFGIINSNLLPKPAFMAYRTTATQLDGAKYQGKIKFSKKDFTGYLFKSKSKKTAIIWKEDKPATLVRRKKITLPMIEISKPETVKLKASGNVYMVDIMGAKTELIIKDGVVSVPVNEYPIFVTGNIEYATSDLLPAPVAKTHTPAAQVQILPPLEQMHGPNDLHNMQHVVRIKLKRETPQFLDVRVHNQTKEDQKGKLYLVEPGSNSDAGWIIKPRVADITVPAEMTTTVRFNINILRRPYTGESPYILKAVFDSNKGKFENNVIVYQMIKHETVTGKLTEDTDFLRKAGTPQYVLRSPRHISGSYQGDNFVAKITSGRQKFVLLDSKTQPVISENGKVDGVIGYSVKQTPDVKISKINLRLTDSDGETFQFQRKGKAPVNKWLDVKFDLSNLKSAVSWGKKKNGKLDLPVKWQGIVIDYLGNSGEISVSPVKMWKKN